ncbi:hypothetical protein KAH94_03120, partial [bacterium]|nr:hypothetical protein [bacterium]
MRNLFSWKSRNKIGKILACAILLNLNLGWVNIFSTESADCQDSIELTRAPRDGDTLPCVSCDSSSSATCPDVDSIRRCVCQLKTLMVETGSDIDLILTIVSTMSQVLEDCCSNIDTTLDTIDSKIDIIDDEVGIIDSKIDDLIDCCETVDSKIDVIDDEVGTIDSKIDDLIDCCETVDSKIDVIDDEIFTVDSKIDVIDDE